MQEISEFQSEKDFVASAAAGSQCRQPYAPPALEQLGRVADDTGTGILIGPEIIILVS